MARVRDRWPGDAGRARDRRSGLDDAAAPRSCVAPSGSGCHGHLVAIAASPSATFKSSPTSCAGCGSRASSAATMPRRLWQSRAATARALGALAVRTFERGERVHTAMLARGSTAACAQPAPAASAVGLGRRARVRFLCRRARACRGPRRCPPRPRSPRDVAARRRPWYVGRRRPGGVLDARGMCGRPRVSRRSASGSSSCRAAGRHGDRRARLARGSAKSCSSRSCCSLRAT